MLLDRAVFHTQLKDVSLRYSYAWNDYQRAMSRGDRDGADDALSRMQEIERSVTIIVRTA